MIIIRKIVRNNQQSFHSCYISYTKRKSVEERNKYMKTDARVRYTQHIIQDVFLNLLKEKPLNKITVKEICTLAEINRGTFYKHYADVYDLMNKLENEALAAFSQMLSSTTNQGTLPVLVQLLTSLLNYREIITPLIANSENTLFLNRLSDCCAQYAISHLAENADFIHNPTTQYTYSYLAGGTNHLIQQWLDSGAKESPQDIAAIIEQFNTVILNTKNAE